MSPEYQEYRKLMTAGRYLEAAGVAEQGYLGDNPNNPFWLTRQSAALTRAGQTERALLAADQALALQPSNPYAVLAKADGLLGAGRLDEALTHYQELTETPKVSDSARWGVLDCLSRLKQWQRVLQSLNQWNLPEEHRLRWRVKALEASECWQEAMDDCRRWLELSPDNPQALWSLVELEVRLEGIDAVCARYGRVARIPSRPPVYKHIYASLCRRAGKDDQALAQYRQLAKTGVTTRVQRKEAFTLAKTGRELEAIPMFEELLKLDPKDTYLHSAYGGACRRVDRLTQALSFYDELLALHPEEKRLYGFKHRIRKQLRESDE